MENLSSALSHLENLSGALSHLERLQHVRLCHPGSCSTALASLLSICIHRLGLTAPGTRFDTQEIARDLQRLSDGSTGCDKVQAPESRGWILPIGVHMGRYVKLSRWGSRIFYHARRGQWSLRSKHRIEGDTFGVNSAVFFLSGFRFFRPHAAFSLVV